MVAKQKRSYRETKDYYELLREDARQAAREAFPASLMSKQGKLVSKDLITLDGLTIDCHRQLRRWEKSGARRVAWDWKTVQERYKTHPKRFELSIWHMDLFLCGASIGQPTKGGGKLRLDFIEANPSGSPLDGLITDINLLCYRVYAKAIGASQLRIMQPVNETVRDYYLSKQGFSYNKKENFCFQDL